MVSYFQRCGSLRHDGSQVSRSTIHFAPVILYTVTHRIHLWYDDLPAFTIEKSTIHAAKCTSPMDPMGLFHFETFFSGRFFLYLFSEIKSISFHSFPHSDSFWLTLILPVLFF